MNHFDQACRFAARLDPFGFMRWLLRDSQPTWKIIGWLDTRTVTFPGERDRISDTVAAIWEPGDPEQGHAIVVEFQTDPDPAILERLLEYVIRLRRELRQDPQGRYQVSAALVSLTGPAQQAVLEMHAPGKAGGELRFVSILRTLSEEVAESHLAAMTSGQVAVCILPWIPLMRSTDESSMIDQWERLAESMPDRHLRSTYAGLALVFSDLTSSKEAWHQALKEWDMQESPTILEWQREAHGKGKAEALQTVLVKYLQTQFQDQVPPDLALAIGQQADPDVLSIWFDLAMKSDTIDTFRKRALPHPATNGKGT